MTAHYSYFTPYRAARNGSLRQMKRKKRPTDEKTWALKKMWAENPPELLEGSGLLTRRRELLSLLDDASANYILTISEREHKTPSRAVGDMVREKVMMLTTA